MYVFLKKNWQYHKSMLILYILLFSVIFSFAGNSTLQPDIKQQEFEVVRKILEEEKKELEQALLASQKELAQLRTLYADTLIRQSKLVQDLQELEIAATNLLQSNEEKSLQKDFTEALATLATLRGRVLKIEEEFAEFEKAMKAALDGMQASEAMRKEVNDRISGLRELIESSLSPLSIVAGRGSGDANNTNCIILSADKQSRSVILNKGFLQGMRSGMILVLERADKILAEVKVVECRADYSAAVIIKGKWTTLLPGSSLNSKK
jgi:uncharacterized membrane-anchored protein YhcB (DUF1043 family)